MNIKTPRSKVFKKLTFFSSHSGALGCYIYRTAFVVPSEWDLYPPSPSASDDTSTSAARPYIFLIVVIFLRFTYLEIWILKDTPLPFFKTYTFAFTRKNYKLSSKSENPSYKIIGSWSANVLFIDTALIVYSVVY